jgi:hypothetical protein
MTTINEQEFIVYVRNYAMRNYDKNGWDYVVEAWEDSDIIEYFSDANCNPTRAFARIKAAVESYHAYAQEIINA